MSFFYSLYNEALYRPLFNALVGIYQALPVQDLGLAIIILTVAIRLVLTPILWKGQKAQKTMALLQPEIKRIQEKFKSDREAQGKALMELYATNKINPLSGCLLALVQLPILIALFHVFQRGLDPAQLQFLYSFIPGPGVINPVSLGILDLSKGNIYLGVIAAVSQFLQMKLSLPSGVPKQGGKDFASIMQKQSLYIFPVVILVWSYTLPSALTLYWTAINLFGIVQEIIVKKFAKTAEKNQPQ